jgi:hypothetical protein
MYSAEDAMGMMRSKWDISPSAAGDMSTGDGWTSCEEEAERERVIGGGDRTGVEGSGYSEMGVIGMNAMQVHACPKLRLGMMNVYMSGEVGEEVGVRTGGAKAAVMRRTGATLDQRPRRECGPRGEV